ncbi:MAG: hypothetical protein U0359_33485 [Byssovorax sp.]
MIFTGNKSISEELHGLGQVWVQISEYRITHAYLEIVLTIGGFRRRVARVWLTDCFYISGQTSGGPCGMSIVEEQTGNGSELTLKAGDVFVAKGLRAGLEVFDK